MAPGNLLAQSSMGASCIRVNCSCAYVERKYNTSARATSIPSGGRYLVGRPPSVDVLPSSTAWVSGSNT